MVLTRAGAAREAVRAAAVAAARASASTAALAALAAAAARAAAPPGDVGVPAPTPVGTAAHQTAAILQIVATRAAAFPRGVRVTRRVARTELQKRRDRFVCSSKSWTIQLTEV